MVYCESIKDFSKKLTEAGALLGIDYGLKKIGISISDKNRVFSMPYDIIKTKRISEACTKIHKIIDKKKIFGLVIGYPLDRDGKEGNSCKNVKEFVEKLGIDSPKLPYYYQDERLSTRSAISFLKTHETSKKNKKEEDDSLAASYILQVTLDLINNSL